MLQALTPQGGASHGYQVPIPAHRFWRPMPAQRLPALCTYQKSRLPGISPASGFRSDLVLSGSLRVQGALTLRGRAHGVRFVSPADGLPRIHEIHVTPGSGWRATG